MVESRSPRLSHDLRPLRCSFWPGSIGVCRRPAPGNILPQQPCAARREAEAASLFLYLPTRFFVDLYRCRSPASRPAPRGFFCVLFAARRLSLSPGRPVALHISGSSAALEPFPFTAFPYCQLFLLRGRGSRPLFCSPKISKTTKGMSHICCFLLSMD